MNLAFFKIDQIIENQDHKVIQIPADGIQFKHKNYVIQNNDPLVITISHDGNYKNELRNISAFAYINHSGSVIGRIMTMNLFSIVSHQEVQLAIYKEIVKQCKVIPLYKPVNERELLAREYENNCELLMGV